MAASGTSTENISFLLDLLSEVREQRRKWARPSDELGAFYVRFHVGDVWSRMREAGLAPPNPPTVPDLPLFKVLSISERDEVHHAYHEALNIAEAFLAAHVRPQNEAGKPPARSRKRVTPEFISFAKKLRDSGSSWKEIQSKVNCSFPSENVSEDSIRKRVERLKNRTN